jgi:hypothetical protein
MADPVRGFKVLLNDLNSRIEGQLTEERGSGNFLDSPPMIVDGPWLRDARGQGLYSIVETDGPDSIHSSFLRLRDCFYGIMMQ